MKKWVKWAWKSLEFMYSLSCTVYEMHATSLSVTVSSLVASMSDSSCSHKWAFTTRPLHAAKPLRCTSFGIGCTLLLQCSAILCDCDRQSVNASGPNRPNTMLALGLLGPKAQWLSIYTKWRFWMHFYCATAKHTHGLAIDVCPSRRLSVKCVDYDKTIVCKLWTLYDRAMFLVSSG